MGTYHSLAFLHDAVATREIDTNDPMLVSDYSMKIEPEFREAKQALEEKEVENANKRDPFGDNKANGFGATDGETGFGDDFKTNGFATQFDTSNGFQSGGFEDGFSSAFDNKPSDPFGSSAGGVAADPFAESKGTVPDASKDEFGCDPFAVLHAPTTASQILSPSPNKSVAPPRPESPSPALPPKKAKQPPPRPAPPRPLQGPTPTKPAPPASMMSSDAFGDSSSGGGFANFADFDNKNLKPAAPSPSTVLPSSNITSSIFGSSSVLSPSPIGARGASVSPIPSRVTAGTTTLPFLLGAGTKNTRALSVSPATVAPAALSVTPSRTISTTPTVPAVDFADDPFKDYRYEDPFNIQDPFADDDEGTSSEDPFSSDSNTLNNNGSLKRLHDPKQTTTTTSHFDDLFGDVQNNNFGSFGAVTTSTTSTKLSTTADPFDAFNDNFTKNSATDKMDTKQELLFRAFGGTEEPSNRGDAFFGAAAKASPFEDEFTRMDDNFAKMDLSSNNNGSNKFGANAVTATNDFANFEVFSNITQNFKNNSSSDSWKRKGNKKSGVFEDDFPHSKKDLPTKFSEDYSRDDDFGADLEAVLERSKRET